MPPVVVTNEAKRMRQEDQEFEASLGYTFIAGRR
jgi:hypothetical protein